MPYYGECVQVGDEWDNPLDSGDDDQFQPTTAIQHLLPHAATLTSLHLDLRYRGETHASPYTPDSEYGWFDIECLSSTQTSLSPFSALKHVFLNASAVCNTPQTQGDSTAGEDEDYALLTRLLPPNIETLCLAAWVRKDVEARMVKALVGLARTVRDGEQFTRLKSVRCDVEMVRRDREVPGEAMSVVTNAFKLTGLDFRWEMAGWEVRGPALGTLEGTPERWELEEGAAGFDVLCGDLFGFSDSSVAEGNGT